MNLEDVKQDIKKVLPQARSITHLASLLGLPRTTLRNRLISVKLPTDLNELTKVLSDNETTSVTPLELNIDNIVKIADLNRLDNPVNLPYQFNINLDAEPFIFILWGDQHIGAGGVNHRALYNEVVDLKNLREKDKNIVLVLNGDLIDGYIKGSSPANTEQVLDLDQQRKLGTWVIEQLKPELTVIADHEMWSVNSASQINFTKDVCERLNINYVHWQGKLNVKAGDVVKTILVHHRYPGKTKTNPVKHLQAIHDERGPADIVCSGHYHSNPGVYQLASKRQNEEPFLAMQNGTNKIGDGYGSKINDYQGEYGIPAVVVLQNGEMFGFSHYTEAVEFKAKFLAEDPILTILNSVKPNTSNTNTKIALL